MRPTQQRDTLLSEFEAHAKTTAGSAGQSFNPRTAYAQARMDVGGEQAELLAKLQGQQLGDVEKDAIRDRLFSLLREEVCDIQNQGTELIKHIRTAGLMGLPAAAHLSQLFPEQRIDDYIRRVIEAAPEKVRNELQHEAVLASNARKTGECSDEQGQPTVPMANFPSVYNKKSYDESGAELERAGCLIWSATVNHIHQRETLKELAEKLGRPAGGRSVPLHIQPFFKELVSSPVVTDFKNEFCSHMQDAVGGKCSFSYGPPGTWFFYNPSTQHINFDVGITLALGRFTEALFHHEHGHHLKTHHYTPTMDKVRQRVNALCQKINVPGIPERGQADMPQADSSADKPKGLSFEEYKELQLLSYEWKLRHQLWNAAEDHGVNRYTCNRTDPKAGGRLRAGDTPLAAALNYDYLFGTGQHKRIQHYLNDGDPKPAGDLQTQLSNVGQAIIATFLISNDLLPNRETGYRALGVDVDAIQNHETGHTGVKALQEMQEMCGRIQAALPHLSLLPTKAYPGKVKEFSQQRAVIIDELTEAFAGPLIKEILKQQEPRVDQQIEELKQQQSGDGQGEGEGKSDQQGEGKESGGEGKEGKGSGKGDGQGKKGKPNGVLIHDPQAAPGTVAPMPDLGHDTDPAQKDTQGAKDFEDYRESKEGEGDKSLSSNVKENANEHINSEQEGARAGEKKDVRAHKPSQSLDDQPLPDIARPGAAGVGAGIGSGSSALDALNLEDGKTIRELIREPVFTAAIDEAARKLQRSAERNVHIEQRVAQEGRILLPPGGDFKGRTDYEKKAEFDYRVRNQLPLDMNTLRMQRDDVEVIHPTLGDVVLLIDGSGSMGSGKKSSMDIAMKSAALMERAANKAGFRCFITLWGDNKPFIISTPWMDEDTRLKNIEAVINGKQCGTQLAPALPHMLKLLLGRADSQEAIEVHPDTRAVKTIGPMQGVKPRRDEWRDPALAQRGPQHWIVISDGGIADPEPSHNRITQLLGHVPNATLDIAKVPDTMRGSHQSRRRAKQTAQPEAPKDPLDQAIAAVHTQRSYQEPQTTHITPKNCLHDMLGLLDKRVQASKRIPATPAATLKKNMERALRSVDDPTRGEEFHIAR